MSPAATVLYTGGDVHRRRRRRALRLRGDPGRRAGRDGARRLGRARHARLGQPLGQLRGRRAARARRCAAASRSATTSRYMERNLTAGLFHAAASLGIAESAHGTSWACWPRATATATDARTQMLAAENAIDLSAEPRDARPRRGAGRRALRGAPDRGRARRGAGRGVRRDAGSPRRSSTRRRCGSSTVRSRCPAAPATSTAHPLARAYRDVRAGAFMHPLGANRAYELAGRVALGLDPGLK